MQNRQIARIACLVLVCFLFVGCTSQEERINRLFSTLPTPPEAELICEQKGTRQGSEDACFFTYKQYLYGTDQEFQQVAEFYVQLLDNTDPWRRDTSTLAAHQPLSWERNNREFSFDIRRDPSMDFPKDVVVRAESEYKTVYFISITYADRIARERCLNEE